MATLRALPNEILILIAGYLSNVGDLAALALTNRQLGSVARCELYAAAARDAGTAKAALFHAAENRLIEAARSLLAHGADPSPVYVSSIPRDCLHRVLAAQGRRAGRLPLVDRNLALETVAAILQHADPCSELATEYRRLKSALLGDIRATEDRGFYSRLHFQMQTVSKQFDSKSDSDMPGTAGAPESVPTPQHTCADDDWYKWTPLHVAAQRGDDELVALLLDSGAAVDSFLRVADDPTYSDSSDDDAIVFSPLLPHATESPLHLAIAGGHESTARLLLARGAPTVVPPGAFTLLHAAAWHGALGVCRLLVDEHAHPVDALTSVRLTPFHCAAAAGHLETVGHFLRERGADVHACFHAHGVLGICAPEWNAFSHALYDRRYTDAWLLWAMDPDFTAPRAHEVNPVEACLASANVSSADDYHLVPILRHLLSRQGDGSTFMRLSYYLDVALGQRLTQAVKLLLEVGKKWTEHHLRTSSSIVWLYAALRDPRFSAAVDTAMVLVDYLVSELGTPTPTLREVFPPSRTSACLPVNLRLREKGVLEARLGIAKLLYQRLAATPQGVDDADLRDALLGACQPGGLPACKWLASQGALRRVGKSDLVMMLNRTTRPEDDGGDDPELAYWVLTKADKLGDKGRVLDEIDVPHMILRHCTLETAVVLGRHGADLGLAVDTRARQGTLLSCQTRQRLPPPSADLRNADCVFLMLLGRPDTAGAVELLRLALDAAGEGARELVNCNLLMPPPYLDQIFTPASLLCSINLPEGIPRTLHYQTDDRYPTPELMDPASESTRLAMLKMLLDAGAEVRTLVEASGGGMDNNTKPGEPLWQALASEDKREISRQQPKPSTAAPGPTTVWKVADWQHDPVRCAIWSRMPMLVQAMLEARPLPTKNHPAALRYLHAACGGTQPPRPYGLLRLIGRLSTQILRIVLSMADLDHADYPLGPEGETALMALLRFYAKNDVDVPVSIHACRCEPDMLGPEKDDLSSMVKQLLAHGAKWQTRCPSTGRTALDELRALMSQQLWQHSIYKQHNLAEFRKHIILDLHSEAAHSAEDFNPFEMGNIKATEGVAGS
jgi:ankyrin repeat protein